MASCIHYTDICIKQLYSFVKREQRHKRRWDANTDIHCVPKKVTPKFKSL